MDDCQGLLKFLRDKKEFARDCPEDDVAEDDIVQVCQEEDSLIYFSGYVAHAVIKKHVLCPLCKACSTEKVPELVTFKRYSKYR